MVKKEEDGEKDVILARQRAGSIDAAAMQIDEAKIPLETGAQLPNHILIKIIKEIYKIARGDYKSYKGFIKKAAAIYKSFTAKRPKTAKELKMESSLEQDAKIMKRLGNDIDIAIIKLKSVNSVDSEQNDLDILRKMVEVSKIISKASAYMRGVSKLSEKARLAFANVSVTTGASGASILNSEASKQNEVNHSSLSKSLRFNLQEATSSVDFVLPISQEQEKRRNEEYARSADDLVLKERRMSKETGG